MRLVNMCYEELVHGNSVMMVNVDRTFCIITLVLCWDFNTVTSLNILGIFPAPAKSHFFVFQPYLRELAIRGHNVTVISYFPSKKPIENYHDIDLSEESPVPDIKLPIKRSSIATFISMTIIHIIGGPFSCRNLMSDEKVQNLLITQPKFDVIVLEQFDSDCSLGLAYKFGAPVVGVTSHMLLPWHYSRSGVPFNPSYVLFDFLEGGTTPTLFQRIQRTFWYNYFYFANKYITQKIEQGIIAEYFDDVPPLEELGSNIKFMLIYQNFVLSGSALLPANVKEVGGYHVQKPNPLPNDINKFIEESEHDIIYISFGSNIKTSSLSQKQIADIIAALDEFPQRVIWKWERKTLPGNPKNIFVSKWLPQNDILAHPKVVAFFSHCGLLGTTEAIYHGVPILGMPIFGDQPANAAAAEESGLGVQIHLDDLTKDNIVDKFKTILDPQFRSHVKLLSKAWREQADMAMDNAVFWTEFAARHNITTRARIAEIPLYQYLCLDVIAVLTIAMFMLIFGVKYVSSVCWRNSVLNNVKPKNKRD